MKFYSTMIKEVKTLKGNQCYCTPQQEMKFILPTHMPALLEHANFNYTNMVQITGKYIT
jgi:hypothetical protein